MGLPAKFVAVDFETTGLYKWRGDRPFAAGAAFPNGTRLFWRNDFNGLEDLLADETLDKVFTNAKFDIGMAEAHGMKVRGQCWDTSILCHLLDGRDATGGLSLEEQAKKYLPEQYRKVVQEIEDWFNEQGYPTGKGRYAKFQELPNDILMKRVVGDADLTLRIFARTFPTVEKHFSFLLRQEHELIREVMDMEDRGILVDNDEIIKQIDHFTHIVEYVQEFCEGVMGWNWFNTNSPAHKRALLEAAGIYEHINEWTKPQKKRKSTKPFVPQRKMDAFNLQSLHHPVAHMLLLGTQAKKMISPFLTQALEFQADNVLHASFNQVGTVSGRFSCSEPNLQNIPVEGDRKASLTEAEAQEAFDMTGIRFAPHIKRIFKCRPGYAHIHADKKQAEMVVLAHHTQDPVLLEIFRRGESIHDGICRELFGEVTKGLKQRGKACTFGYQYGAGAPVIARKMGGSVREAAALMKRYGLKFTTLPKWRARLEDDIKERGYVLTSHGRRHYLWKNEAYMAVNRVCQGEIGDEIKGRMIVVNKELRREGIDGRILLNIHDDLCIECAIPDVPRAVPLVARLMHETNAQYILPMPSSMDITYTSWADLKEISDVNDASSYTPEAIALALSH